MEPIGQKVVMPSSEEIVVSSELDDNSLENFETRIFDETLDGVLSELHAGEDVKEDLVNNVGGSNSEKSNNLTKNQFDSKIAVSDISSIDMVDSNIALEVMEEILLSDEVSIEKKDIFQKTENLVPDISEAKEIRIEKNEDILDLSKDNVAANKKDDKLTGKNNVSENQLQTFFHLTNRKVENSEFPEDFQDDIVKKTDNEEIHSLKSNYVLPNIEPLKSESSELESFLPLKNQEEPDYEVANPVFFKTNQEIVQTKSLSKSVEKLDDSEIANLNEPESELSISQQSYFKDKNQIVGEFQSDIEEKALNITGRLKKDSIENFEYDSSDLNKVVLDEITKNNFTNFNKEELSNNIKNFRLISDFRTDENLNKKVISQFANNEIIENQKPTLEGIKSEEGAIGTEVFEVSEDQKLIPKDYGEVIVKAKVNKKVLDEGNSMFNERVKASLQDENIFKAPEGQKIVVREKLNELSEPLTEKFKVSEEQKVVVRENLNELREPLTEKFKVAEGQKIVVRENLNEDFQVLDNKKISEEQQVLAKMRGFNDQLIERSVPDELPIAKGKKGELDINIPEKDFIKDFSEKPSIETQKSHIKFSSQDIESPVNSKSFTESYNPLVINSNADSSKVSGVKVGEITNSMTDTLRNVDTPFNIEQIVSRVRILRGNGVEEMTLRLNPEDLGQITLKIRQSGADLSIDMRVDNPQAKQLVESGFDSLRNRFLDNDFSYQDLALNVDINERDSQFDRERRNSEFEENISSVDRKEKEDPKHSGERVNKNILTDSGLNLYV